MKELNEEEIKQTLNEVNVIISKIVNKEINDVKQIAEAIAERIKDESCREWLLSVLIAEHTFKQVQAISQMMEKTKDESQDVMFR